MEQIKDQNQKFEELSVIRDEMIADPNVPSRIIWDAAKLALEDDYLNSLMLDWMKTTDSTFKSQLLDEVISYTEEKLRMLSLNESN